MGALLGLEPVSGRKVNSWDLPLPLCSLEHAEEGAGSSGSGCHAFISCRMSRLDCG